MLRRIVCCRSVTMSLRALPGMDSAPGVLLEKLGGLADHRKIAAILEGPFSQAVLVRDDWGNAGSFGDNSRAPPRPARGGNATRQSPPTSVPPRPSRAFRQRGDSRVPTPQTGRAVGRDRGTRTPHAK